MLLQKLEPEEDVRVEIEMSDINAILHRQTGASHEFDDIKDFLEGYHGYNFTSTLPLANTTRELSNVTDAGEELTQRQECEMNQVCEGGWGGRKIPISHVNTLRASLKYKNSALKRAFHAKTLRFL